MKKNHIFDSPETTYTSTPHAWYFLELIKDSTRRIDGNIPNKHIKQLEIMKELNIKENITFIFSTHNQWVTNTIKAVIKLNKRTINDNEK